MPPKGGIVVFTFGESSVTELEAVNECLKTIREQPVSTLSGPLTDDVAIALDTLRAVSTEVQSMGWTFNTEYNVTYNPDNNGRVFIPSTALLVQVSDDSQSTEELPVQRGDRMYDAIRKTDLINKAVKASKVISALGWSELPPAAQRFITMKAARLFGTRILGSDKVRNDASVEEMNAWRNLVRYHVRVSRPNALLSPGVVDIAWR